MVVDGWPTQAGWLLGGGGWVADGGGRVAGRRPGSYIHIGMYVYTYMHTYIHTYMHACMRACIPSCMHTDRQTDRQTYIHIYISLVCSLVLGTLIRSWSRGQVVAALSGVVQVWQIDVAADPALGRMGLIVAAARHL